MELLAAPIRNIKKIFQYYIAQASERSGFTLVELVVVIAMLAVLMLGLIFTFNPLSQSNKAQDAQREHDLAQIQRALDTYFNDTGCYPTSLSFGSFWKSTSGAVYMEKVPQDVNCAANPSKCYVYQVPSGSCPQWNVLYAALRSTAVPNNACPLSVRNTSAACVPAGYGTNGYNFCVTSGQFDCSVIAGSTVLNSGTGGTGGSGGSLTPTPTPFVCSAGYYGCSAGSGGTTRCNSESPPQGKCIGFGGTLQCYCDSHCSQSCTFN